MLNKKLNILLVIAALTGCQKNGFFKADEPLLDINKSISIVVDRKDGRLADGQQISGIHFKLLKSDSSDFFTVSYPDSAGKLLPVYPGGKIFVKNDTASVNFQAGTIPGRYVFSARLNNKVSTDSTFTIETIPSLPDTILVETDKSRGDTASNSFVTFSIYLKKKIGRVSYETPVNARAYQTRNGINIQVGRFTGLVNNKSNSDGKIQLQFFTDTKDLDASGTVHLQFFSATNLGTTTTADYYLIMK